MARSRAFGVTLLAAAASVAAIAIGAYLLAPMRWPQADGIVLSSAWVDSSGNKTRGATLQYQYEVEGRSYMNDRLSLFRSSEKYDVGSGQWLWDDRRLVREHPRGSQITVRYDPSSPSRSVVVAHANMPGIWGAGVVLLVLWSIAIGQWIRARTSGTTSNAGDSTIINSHAA